VDVNTDSLIIHYVKPELDETTGEILASHEILPAPEE